ncbi:MAG TPA: cupredoxin domain-containing protein [Actinomycetota bacterium]|nr:cupredoxin domain-containing protein [Actinomycetota bacterium]
MRNRTLLIAGLVFALGSLVGASLTTPGWRFGASMRNHMARMWGQGSESRSRPAVPGAREITVVADEFRFSPSRIEVPSGEPVNITLVNEGDSPHDLTISSLDFQLVGDPDSRSVGSLTLEQGDEVSFECSVLGHAQAGMTGVMVGTSG